MQICVHDPVLYFFIPYSNLNSNKAEVDQKKKERAYLKELEEKERLEGNHHFIPTVFWTTQTTYDTL